MMLGGHTDTMVTGPEPSKRTEHPSTEEGDEDPVSKQARIGDEDGETIGDTTCSPPGSIKDSTAGGNESKSEELGVEAVKEDLEASKPGSAAAVRAAFLMEEDLQLDAGFTTFPEKLMRLLDSEEVKDRMWWLPDGEGFAFKPDNFAETVLAQHFGGTRLESFTRKLNRWGFKRVAGQMVPINAFAYYHRRFLRGKPELVKDMSGSKNTRALKRLQQVPPGAVRRDGEAALPQAFPQPHLGPQVRGMMGGEMFFPNMGASGADPRLEFYLMQQRNQQLEQQSLASLDPDSHMRMVRARSAYHGFPPGMNPNLMSQNASFNQRVDPSNNATTAALMNERMTTMRHAASQQQNIVSAPGPWMQMHQHQQQDQQPPPIVDINSTNQVSPPAGAYALGQGQSNALDSTDA